MHMHIDLTEFLPISNPGLVKGGQFGSLVVKLLAVSC